MQRFVNYQLLIALQEGIYFKCISAFTAFATQNKNYKLAL
jgi:hypothetical protein